MGMISKEDSLRIKGLAILLLLFHHLYFSDQYIVKYNLKINVTQLDYVIPIAIMFRICVWLFCFVSAYGLTIQYMNKDSKISDAKWMLKYFISVEKNLLFVYVVYYFIAVDNPLSGIQNAYEGRMFYLILDMLGLANWFGTPSINGVWWYVGLTLMVILLVPFVKRLVQSYGFAAVMLLYFLMQLIDYQRIYSEISGSYLNYFMVVVLGAWCAKKGCQCKQTNNLCKMIILIGCALLIIYWRYRFFTNTDVKYMHGLLGGISAMLLCYGIVQWKRWKLLSVILEFLGKYSMNMYFMHNVFYKFFPNYLFAFKNPFIVYIVLVCSSLMVSILIEGIKNISGYNKLFVKLTNYVCQYRKTEIEE